VQALIYEKLVGVQQPLALYLGVNIKHGRRHCWTISVWQLAIVATCAMSKYIYTDQHILILTTWTCWYLSRKHPSRNTL